MIISMVVEKVTSHTHTHTHTHTHRFVMNEVSDLQELVSLSENDLERLLGNNANAKLLWTFLHTELQVTARTRSRKKA